MLTSNSIKKIRKKFSSFTEEEHWLQQMLHEGWILKDYNSEDDVSEYTYRFEPSHNEEQKNRIYKIDFRSFNRKKDYLEFCEIFEDAGWSSLSNHWMSKHIFYTDDPQSHGMIFSDIESYREREKRKMKDNLLFICLSIIASAILFVLYITFERSSFMGVSLLSLAYCGKLVIDYFKHRKMYKILE